MDNEGEYRRGSRGGDGYGNDSFGGKSTNAGKIFVGGISWETTTEKLTRHFKRYGEIIDSVVMRDRSTRQPRGFGFVTYADPSVIDKVIKDTHLIDGRTVEIKRSVPRESMVKGPRTKKIFVGGLLPSVTEDEFKRYFSQFGVVVENQIMLEHSTGLSRGFGFITFDDEQAVDDLLSQDRTLELGGKQIEIKKAEPKKASSDSGPRYRSPPGRRGGNNNNGYRHGGYGSFDEDYSRTGYRGASYGTREGYFDEPYGGRGGGGYVGAYGSNSSVSGYGASSSLGGYGSSRGYGGYGDNILNQYGDADSYGRGGGGYGNYDSGYSGETYGSTGGFGGSIRGSGYGYDPSSSFGGGYGARTSGRYHPYARN